MKKFVSPGRHFRVDHPRKVIGDGDVAFARGGRAFVRGDAIEDCPYGEEALADSWRSGWLHEQDILKAKTLRE